MILGLTRLSLKFPTATALLQFEIIDQQQNIIGWPAVAKFQLLKPYFDVNLIQQPNLPQFPGPIFELIRRCSPLTPIRSARYEISITGEYTPPRTPIQSPPRPMPSDKLKCLQNWMENMFKLEVIAAGQLGDPSRPEIWQAAQCDRRKL